MEYKKMEHSIGQAFYWTGISWDKKVKLKVGKR